MYPQPKKLSQEEKIEQNMSRKELAIRIAGATRDATMITVAKLQHQKMTDEEIKKELIKWKKYIYELSAPSPF
jgi:hypothetical protein